MAPAPPGNETSDWLVSPRPVTSLPRAPPLSGAPAQSPAGGSKSAQSLPMGGGAGFAGSWKARETLLPAAKRAVTAGKGGAPLLGSAFFSCQFLSSTQVFCSDFRPASVGGRTPSPCPSVFAASSDRVSRPPSAVPVSFAAFRFLATPPLPEPTRSAPLPRSGIAVGSPRGELTALCCCRPFGRVKPKCPRNLKSFSTSLF